MLFNCHVLFKLSVILSASLIVPVAKKTERKKKPLMIRKLRSIMLHENQITKCIFWFVVLDKAIIYIFIEITLVLDICWMDLIIFLLIYMKFSSANCSVITVTYRLLFWTSEL